MQKISIKDIENSMLYPNYIKINDFLYEICSFHRFLRCILIEILGISWKIHKLTWTFENFREFWNNLENFRSEIFQILTKKKSKKFKISNAVILCTSCVTHRSVVSEFNSEHNDHNRRSTNKRSLSFTNKNKLFSHV